MAQKFVFSVDVNCDDFSSESSAYSAIYKALGDAFGGRVPFDLEAGSQVFDKAYRQGWKDRHNEGKEE